MIVFLNLFDVLDIPNKFTSHKVLKKMACAIKLSNRAGIIIPV